MIIVDRKSRAKSIKITYNPTSINFAGIIMMPADLVKVHKIVNPYLK